MPLGESILHCSDALLVFDTKQVLARRSSYLRGAVSSGDNRRYSMLVNGGVDGGHHLPRCTFH
jgi:hypothetical protein